MLIKIKWRLLWMVLLWTGCPLLSQDSPFKFIYQDIANFRIAYQRIQSGEEPETAIAWYLEEGTSGLNTWGEIYGFSSEKFADRVMSHPKFFQSLLRIDEQIKPLEQAITEGYRALWDLYPGKDSSYLPTYFFITDLGGGGSVREQGSLIGVDYFGLSPSLDLSEFPERIAPKGSRPMVSLENLTHVTVHEMTHWLQRTLQGENYLNIYRNPDESTLLAYAIREGGADFITFLASGYEDKPRNDFGKSHEESIWRDFEKDMLLGVDKAPGWFSGRFKDNREWPYQIGYFIGMAMVSYYYEKAFDKKEALRFIFSAYHHEDFKHIVRVYRSKYP